MRAYLLVISLFLVAGCSEPSPLMPPNGPTLLAIEATASEIWNLPENQYRLSQEELLTLAVSDYFQGMSRNEAVGRLDDDGFSCREWVCTFAQVMWHPARGITTMPEPGYVTRYLEITFRADPVGGPETLRIERWSEVRLARLLLD